MFHGQLGSKPAAPRTRFLRFALYGRAEAGKTCYLAALAMARISNPRGYTCDWLSSPDDCPRPPTSGDIDAWYAQRPEAALARGREWLEKAIAALGEGDVPPPNANRLVMRLRFAFRGHQWAPPEDAPAPAAPFRNYRIELIDYSGELIDDKLADTDLAQRVRDHLRDTDGLIVLAEAPRPGQVAGAQSNTLLRLRGAFEAIRAAKWDAGNFCPVALVVNKGDRLLESEQYAPAGADQRLEEFLSSRPEPPHKQLRDALRAAVGAGNFRAFVASAFGKVQVKQIHSSDGRTMDLDMPSIDTRLESFGLEDPFMWLAARRESLLLERVGETSRELAPWKVWQLGDGTHAKLGQDIRAAAELTRESPKQQADLRAASQSMRLMMGKQAGVALGTVLGAVLLGILGIRMLVDRSTFARHSSLPVALSAFPSNPQDLGRLHGAKAWLAEYAESSWSRLASNLLVLSRTSARQRLAEIDERLMLEDVGALLNKASSGSALALADQRIREVERMPLTAHGQLVLKQIATLRQRMAGDNETREADAQIFKDLNASDPGDLVAQARILVSKPATISQAARDVQQQLAREFGQKFEASARTIVRTHLEAQRWEPAVQWVQATMIHPAVRELVPDAKLAELARSLEDEVNRNREGFYYTSLRARPSKEGVNNYLTKVPAPTRTSRVEAKVKEYEKYLHDIETPATYYLVIKSIDWGNSKSDYKTRVIVTAGTVKAYSNWYMTRTKGFDKIGNGENVLVAPNGSLDLRVETEYWSSSQGKPWARAARSLAVKELGSESGVPIRLDEGPYGSDGQVVTLQITGLPQARLPDYETLVGR